MGFKGTRKSTPYAAQRAADRAAASAAIRHGMKEVDRLASRESAPDVSPLFAPWLVRRPQGHCRSRTSPRFRTTDVARASAAAPENHEN